MALHPGIRFGVYEITALIGEGGMGQVYRARDTRLERDVAIKVLPEVFAHDAERVARFEREAKTLASLNHPNIAQVYGFEASSGTTTLVMELVEGEDLSQVIARQAIPVSEALPIAKQIAEALEAAHEQGIIHRDLKPANIKVRSDGTVKVLDFGLAKAVQPSGSGLQPRGGLSQSPTITTPAMTQAGMILGTAAYMAPEQAKGRPADKRADIWAFGVVLYEMLAGRGAFARDDVAETLAVVLTKEPDWDALPASTPVELRRLLTRCLKKDPKARMRDIGEARLQIEALLSGVREEVAGAPSTVAPRPSSRLVAALPWAVAALAIGVAIGIFMWSRDARSRSPVRFVVLPPEDGAFVATALHQAISPDGQHLAFIARVNNGPSAVWVRPLGDVAARMLQGTEGATTIFWSPDSSALAFASDDILKRTAVTNGAVQKVTDAVSRPGFTGSWNRDGAILFGPGQDGRLYRVRESGGAASPVTPPGGSDGAATHLMPQFLPDGARFLYFSRPGGDVLLGTLDGAAPKRLLKADCKALYSANHLLFVRESTLFAQPFLLDAGALSGEPTVVASGVRCNPGNGGGGFSVSDNGVLTYRGGDAGEIEQMTWVDRAGKVEGLLGDRSSSYNLALSPDGKVVATDQLLSPGDIWLTDVRRGPRIRLTSNESANRLPVWSADSTWVALASDRDGGTFNLYRKWMNRSDQEELLLKTSANKRPTDVSSDGHFLLYDEVGSTTGSDIWVLPLTGDRTPFPYVQTKFGEGHGAFSPDGRWVTYTSDEAGRRQVYVQPFPATGASWPVSIDGGTHPQWRRDQKELLYFDLERRVVAVAVDVSGPSPDVGTPQILFRTNAPPDLGWNRRFYSVRSDGQRFLISNVVEGLQTPPITVVLNWMADADR